jgi:hypothetical protein
MTTAGPLGAEPFPFASVEQSCAGTLGALVVAFFWDDEAPHGAVLTGLLLPFVVLTMTGPVFPLMS